MGHEIPLSQCPECGTWMKLKCRTCYITQYRKKKRETDPEWVQKKRDAAKAWNKRNPERLRANKNRIYHSNDQHREHVKQKASEWFRNNRERSRERSRRWREENRDHVIARRFGTTKENLWALYTRSERRCEVCKRRPSGGRKDPLVVDHCHDTGRVRGLLCAPCNFVLGHAERIPELMSNALHTYLELTKQPGE